MRSSGRAQRGQSKRSQASALRACGHCYIILTRDKARNHVHAAKRHVEHYFITKEHAQPHWAKVQRSGCPVTARGLAGICYLQRAYIGGLPSASYFYAATNILKAGWIGVCAMSDSKQDWTDRFGGMSALLMWGIAFFIAAIWFVTTPSFEKCSAVQNVAERNGCYDQLRKELFKPPAKGADILKG